MYQSDEYFTVVEGMTSVSAVINAALSKKSARKILRVLVSQDVIAKKRREVGFLRAKSPELSYSLEIVDSHIIDEVCRGTTHGGIAAFCGQRVFPPLSGADIPKNGFIAALEGIEDPYNLGYTVRSLYAAGADAILLPERNWMDSGSESTVIKSSAGTIELSEVYCGPLADAASLLKASGYKAVCAGIRNSVSLQEANLSRPILLIIGGEKRGISRSLLELGDFSVRIDYARNFIGSLTTASSAAVIAFEVMRQNKIIL